jgi:hypothetical protein
MNDQMTEKERMLWKQAKKRVEFRKHLFTYIIVNGFLWAIWFFTDRRSDFPWPIWPTLGWGIGLAFSGYNAYFGTNLTAVEREYERLKNKQ